MIGEWGHAWFPSLDFCDLKLSKKQEPSKKTPGTNGKNLDKGASKAVKKTAAVPTKAASKNGLKLEVPAQKKAKLLYRFFGGEMAIGYCENAELELALLLLGMDMPVTRISQADKSVLLTLGKRCLDDLYDRITTTLSDVLKNPSGFPDTAPMETANAMLSDSFWSGEVVGKNQVRSIRLGFAVHEDVLIRHRLRMSKPLHRNTQLTDRMHAIGDCAVTIGGRIGATSLSVAELNALEAGDVLILDQSVEDNIELTVDGNAGAIPACTLRQNEDGFYLEIK
ncbi:flagellar motor switch protein FliM [Sphingorhabdus sp. Alg239-R122]|uniref:FliM/FliN family flagellar motor switch protein n=1 Tax=Sphingorhabdus sp. Alg239-R122 TaxID=2305989 RepID=UPI0013DA439A|nr:flagellar motor switch protein FliM [Sphingorhabdus sp. Alg239-R122]